MPNSKELSPRVVRSLIRQINTLLKNTDLTVEQRLDLLRQAERWRKAMPGKQSANGNKGISSGESKGIFT